MHIVFISNEYPLWTTGGKGTFIKTISAYLVKQGHHVVVLGTGKGHEKEVIDDHGIQVIRLRKSITPKATYIENFWRIRKELKLINKIRPIDIVETSELDCAYLSKKTPYKKVIRLHGGHHFFALAENRGIDPRKGNREKKSFANADAFIAISDYVKEHTSTYLSFHDKPMTTIRLPIDLQMFQPHTHIEVEKNNITFVGTLCEKKGVRQLIQAFQIMERTNKELILNLYGRDWFYPNGKSYREEMETLAGSSNIIFHGEIPFENIPSVYAKAQVCVFPSHMETQGLVAPEAMAMGKLVVFSETGPGKETITDGVNGFLCDPSNPDHIAKKTMEALNCLNKKEIQQNAINFARKTFSLEGQTQENLNFYKTIIQ